MMRNLLSWKEAIGEPGDDRSDDFQDDDDEENIVDRLEHAVGEKRANGQHPPHGDPDSHDGHGEENDPQGGVKHTLNAFDPALWGQFRCRRHSSSSVTSLGLA